MRFQKQDKCKEDSYSVSAQRGVDMKEVPIWEKSNLTLQEAAAYSGIGVNKLRELSDEKGCKFVLWNGNKRLIKRKELDKFTESSFSI